MSESLNPTEWITTKEAAELTGYHVNYIRKLIRCGKILGLKRSGRDWWVDKTSTMAYFEEMKRLGTAKHSPDRSHRKQ